MSEDDTLRPDDGLPAEEVSELIRRLPTPGADPAFRARLRRAFVEGNFAEEEETEAPAHAVRATPRARSRSASRERGARVLRPAWWRNRTLAGLAAAAMLILLAIPVAGAYGRDWDLLGVEGSGRVKIDGEWLAVHNQSDADEIARRLRKGARLETEGDVQVTVKRDRVVICLQPGACFELPVKSPWWNPKAEDLPGRLLGGSVHVMTGHPQTEALRIETDDTTVKLGNCSAGVECSPDGTCVLVLKGAAYVTGEEGDCVVEEGQRRFPCPIGNHPRIDTLTDEQRVQLDRTDAAWSGSMDD